MYNKFRSNLERTQIKTLDYNDKYVQIENSTYFLLINQLHIEILLLFLQFWQNHEPF